MGKALAERLSLDHELFLYDRNRHKMKDLEKLGYGIACENLADCLKQSSLIILAVKPQSLKEVVLLFPKDQKSSQKLLSILSGITLAQLKQAFPAYQVLRMMPNLAIKYGQGVIGVSALEISQENKDEIDHLLQPLGKIIWIAEAKMNGLTALTGSGPAFILTMIEAMIDAGIALGFNADQSQELVLKAVEGSLALLTQEGKHPGQIRWEICSPAGTTIAGLEKLEQAGIRAGIMQAFQVSCQRAKELSQ